jgi:MoaA/NifB/PqqE/SkfB family radical SAM enzyme/GT2 family glycosyltransferase
MHPLIASKAPRTLWIELTSKCPLDCVFCSRKTRRGAGEHMPYDLFESLVRQVADPRTFLLNYSGESTVYPELVPAIRLARSAGASVELVSALVNVAETALPELCESGLSRLTVSVHSTDAARYAQIYRYGTFEALRTRLSRFLELCRERSAPPVVDLAFVAMDCNLQDLPGVAGFARSLGLRDIYVFPVIRRDEIPIQFLQELTEAGVPRSDFEERVKATVERAASASPGISLTICDPSFTTGNGKLGEVPHLYPGILPPDARIHSCEQNPWETTHVLSNGDVVACEVLDKIPLGNLDRQSLSEIWHGEAYRAFRERYHRGEVPECRSCPWKLAYRPGPLQSDVIGARGRSAQLLYGWHEPCDKTHIWASQQALAVIAPRDGSRVLHVSGMLPPGPEGDANELVISCNGVEIGRVANPWAEVMPFGLDFSVDQAQFAPWFIQFRTRHLYRPAERGMGSDQRDLGFALFLLTAKPFVDPAAVERWQKALWPLPYLVRGIDGIGRPIGRYFGRRRVDSDLPLAPGLSVLIPERDNVTELSDCLSSVHEAAARWTEPIEVIVIVNGSPASSYASLQARYPVVQWQFSERPLGFCGAVTKGLRVSHFDWVYLLNSDVVLDPGALEEVGRHRDAGIFSVASQIVLKDPTRFRDETNWTALFVDDGLVTIHDRIPQSGETVAGFYAGGGASLFQTRLLRRFARVSAYYPFYWEDVEWGWRARKLGYCSLFCAYSVAHHTRRSTIDRHYRAAEVDRVLERNRFLFQLRNLTTAGSLKRVREELARSPDALAGYFLRSSTLWKIACGRLWNHFAPIPDEEVLTEWNGSVSRSSKNEKTA